MKNNQEQRYPMSLFMIGFIMNLIKNFFLLIPAIILLIIGIWIKWCLLLGIVLLVVDVVASLAEQFYLRNVVLNSDNPDFKEWQDAALSNDWKNNVMDLTANKIRAFESEKSEND